ncbi:hypothetical protein HDE_08611 [Halotydeus destructor]|nr:hypothetical protein HDE_08611 [Halotydeus destructor]
MNRSRVSPINRERSMMSPFSREAYMWRTEYWQRGSFDVQAIATRPCTENEAPKSSSSWIQMQFKDIETGLKSIFIIICVSYTVMQIVSATKYYFEFDTGVAVNMDEPTDLKSALPGFTICNKNLISKEAAFKYADGLKEADEMVTVADTFEDEKERFIERVHIYEDYMTSYYYNFSVKDQLSHGPSMAAFLKYVKCNEKAWDASDVDGQVHHCENTKTVNTAQGKGNCITLFHYGNTKGKEDSNQNHVKNPSNLDSVMEQEVENFVPNEIMKVLLDFAPENYTDLRMAPGGEVMFHDDRTIPLEASLSYTLRPGKYYQFYLKKSSTHALPPPYKTMCSHYYESNVHKYQNKKVDEVNFLLQHPLSETQCKENCVIEKVARSSQCWPKEVPYWANNQLNLNDSTLLWCHRMNQTHEVKKAAFQRYVDFKNECNKLCARDCIRDYYHSYHQEIDWPSKERILVEENEDTKRMLMKLKQCCALVSVRYSTKLVSINDIYAKRPFVTYLADVGGIISMWIGVCLLSIFDFCHWLVVKCNNK